MEWTPRPPSRPRGSVPSVREHFALIQQVRTSLEESVATPPADADLHELASRRELLTKILKHLEQEGLASRNIRQNRVDERREASARADEEKMAREIERRNYKHATHLISNVLHKRDLADVRAAKSADHARKVLSCRDHHARLMATRVEELAGRQKVLEDRQNALSARRHAETLRLQSARLRAAGVAEDKRMEAQQREEAQCRSRLGALQLQREIREERAETARAARDQERRCRAEVQRQRRMDGPSTRTVALFSAGGKAPTLCRVVQNHEQRMAALAQREKESMEAYSADQELRDALKGAMGQRGTHRRDRAARNLEDVSQKRISKAEDIMRAQREKAAFVERMEFERQTSASARGVERSQIISDHRRRADSLLSQRMDGIATANMARWNSRSASNMDAILDSYRRFEHRASKAE